MRNIACWVITIVLLTAAASMDRVAAQGQDATYSAAIYVGDCEGDFDEVRAPLTDPIQGNGDAVGQTTETITATSFTTVPVAFDQLLDADHAIGIQRSGDDSARACGELGGVPTEQGDLLVGLRQQEDSGLTGVAYLTPSTVAQGQTDISVLIFETEAEPEEQETAVPEETPDTEAGSGETDLEDQVATPVGEAADAVFSGEERQYATTLARQSTLVIASLRRVDALFEEPQVGDEGWTNQLAAELTLWQILSDEAQAIEPPPAFLEVHETYVEALGLLDDAATDIFSGLSGGDQELISQGTEQIEQAVQRIGDASKLVDELAAERTS